MPSVDAELAQAAELLQQAVASWDPERLQTAVEQLSDGLGRLPPDHPHRAGYLANLAVALHTRSSWWGNPDDLDAAVEAGIAATAAASQGAPQREMILNNLVPLVLSAYGRDGDPAVVHRAVESAGSGVFDSGTSDPLLVGMLVKLDNRLSERYEQTGALTDLDTAVAVSERALDAVPDGQPRAVMLWRLAWTLRTRYGRTGAAADLDRTVVVYEEALAVVPPDEAAIRSELLLQLGSALAVRYDSSGSGADIARGITVTEEAAGDPDKRWMALSHLSGMLRSRFGRTGDVDDVQRAVEAGREAVRLAPPTEPAVLTNLAAALRSRFGRSGVLADLDETIDLGERALTLMPDDAAAAIALSNLGFARRVRFERTGEAADLDRAVEVGERAVAATDPSDPSRTGKMDNAGVSRRIRYEHAGDRDDLDRAVELGVGAVTGAPDGHPDLTVYLANLGLTYRRRFHAIGAPADLDAALAANRRAVEVATVGSPLHGSALSGLSLALASRYGLTGAASDLHDAVRVGEQAVDALPADHPTRTSFLNNLAAHLQDAYRRTRSLPDLDQAIRLTEEAIARTAEDDPRRTMFLNNLAGAHLVRFDRSGDEDDVRRGVAVGTQALGSPSSPALRATVLGNVGAALSRLHDLTGDRATIDRAVTHLSESVALTPAGHPDLAVRSSNLGVAWSSRYGRSDDPADLAAAIDQHRRAATLTAADDPHRTVTLTNLGGSLERRAARADLAQDPREVVAVYREAAGVTTASAAARIRAATGWGRAAVAVQDWNEGEEGYAAAVGFLSRVVTRDLDRRDQEYWLTELAGLGADAAAACLQAGHPERAVELWEQGRGVLLSQALHTRTDLTVLAAEHASLAGEFRRLRDELDSPADGGGQLSLLRDGAPVEDAVAAATAARRAVIRRREQVEEFDRLLARIRSRPGFARFLLPPRLSDLVPAADRGPVVLVNVSSIRSDALLLTTAGVRVVPLTGVAPNAVVGQVVAFVSALERVHGSVDQADVLAAEQQLTATLAWLWDRVAEPVLTALGVESERVWWCPSGLLAFLPLHAAGRHDTRSDPVPHTVLDRLVSSSTPTVTALLHARRPLPGGGDRVLVVSMPHTPGASDLPGAATEAEMLRRTFPGRTTILHGAVDQDQATRLGTSSTGTADHDRVCAELTAHRWVHFACHAESDLADPSRSHLLLVDHRERPLTVVDLLRLQLDGGELAFLSACATARTGPQLADEAVQLAAAVQLAGYRHVVATLWPVGDQTAVRIARDVYAALALDASDPARAVRDAVRRRRDLAPHRPSDWASHMHSGA